MEGKDTKGATKRFRRGIYLLPNLFTVGALFLGYYAIVMATKGQFESSSIAILMAMVMDGLDGRVARMTQTQSEFGAQLDSLSDLISFGLAPSLVVYLWILAPLGKLGWLAAFIYTVCGALRLARFNSEDETLNKRYFRGLSIPMAAGLVATLTWVCVIYQFRPEWLELVVAVLVIGVGLLEISTVRYRSFKDIDIRGKVPFYVILLVTFLIILISFNPPVVLLCGFSLYMVSGLFSFAYRKYRWRRIKENK